MNRLKGFQRLRQESTPWDILIIGGGATGLGAAVDAAARGYRVALVEQHDFAKGTSSRSTKLLHGGVRYLKQGNVSLVRDAVRERGLACRNAPHLSKRLGFIIPAYKWNDKFFYGAGLMLYDRLAGQLSLGRSRVLSREDTMERLPTVRDDRLRGGILYYDGQFDDARMAISLARTAADRGAVILNYARVSGLILEEGRVRGVELQDEETGDQLNVRAKCVINAAGVFSDGIRKMESDSAQPMLVASQGSHLVLPREYLPGEDALMVPKTEDGRVLFALPWQNRVILGTTDVAVDGASLEPRPLEDEIEFLLEHAGKYLKEAPGRSDILSAFSGLRPLVSAPGGKSTSSLSRDHTIVTSEGGLVTILGGKWTTYRKMAADVVDRAERVAGLPHRPCATRFLQLRGGDEDGAERASLAIYGSDARHVEELLRASPELGRPLHPRLDILWGQVAWAARHEMARTVEDVLSRRTRALLHDARAASEAAPLVARLLAQELGRDEAWQKEEVLRFQKLSRHYQLPDNGGGPVSAPAGAPAKQFGFEEKISALGARADSRKTSL